MRFYGTWVPGQCGMPAHKTGVTSTDRLSSLLAWCNALACLERRATLADALHPFIECRDTINTLLQELLFAAAHTEIHTNRLVDT